MKKAAITYRKAKTKVLKPKVAIVYDRVNKWGGAERVLLALHEIFPDAPLYTSLYNSKNASWAGVFPKIATSSLQKIPFAKSHHEFLAPLMPFAFASFDFSKYDLVISITSEFAKNINTNNKTKHLCYCLTPTRYLWSGYEQYFKGNVFRNITWPLVVILRKLDRKAAKKPDEIIAISSIVQKRIKKYYLRDSEIIFPPVELSNNRFIDSKNVKYPNKKYFLIVSRLVGYKKVDLAISAFNKLNLPLVIVGTGRQEKRLKRIAGKNIIFAGRVSEDKLIQFYKGARALIMPQEEDFGIVSVEAQNAGVPVIAYKNGGASDTVINGETGVYFSKQTVQSLSDAVKKFEKMKFNKKKIINNALRFDKSKFQKKFLDFTEKMLN